MLIYQIFGSYRVKKNWMREGDRNTAFFHAKATKRSQIIQVDGLTDKNGVMCHTKKGMADIVVNYFLGLFDTSSPEEQTMDEVLSVIEPRMTAHENHLLTRPFTSKEVADALSSMSPLKSHRPDDFPVLFYKKFGVLSVLMLFRVS